MRIISGSLKGKKLSPFKGSDIRPTSDRVKEALFNIISHELIEDATVLDLFAGTGNLGIEALSRGAKSVLFVEKNRSSLAVLKENLTNCSIDEKARLLCLDAKKALCLLEKENKPFDLIFLDPPYNMGLSDRILEILGKGPLLNKSLVIAEHASKEEIKAVYNKLTLTDSRRYGDTSLSFFKEKNK